VNAIMMAVKASKNGNSTDSTWPANALAAISPLPGSVFSASAILRLKSGTNTAANAPSANSARNRLGSRHAIRNASEASPAPT